MAEDAGSVLEWRCIVTDHLEVGTGRARHVEYRAQVLAAGRAMNQLQFRFSDLDRLSGQLKQMSELRGTTIPPLPPKVTIRSMLYGQFNEAFQDERHVLVQQFLEQLFATVQAIYEGVGDCVELCEPLNDFFTRAAERGAEAEAAEVQRAVAAAESAETQEIRAQQDAEYEECLRRDRQAEEDRIAEARAAEEAARAEAERQAAEEARAKVAAEETAAKAARAVEELAARSKAFEAQNPVPGEGEAQAQLRIRAPSGETKTRRFPVSARVDVVFEFVAVAEWAAPIGGNFDLRTSYPVRSLNESRDQTLEAAGLCPSAALVIKLEEDD